MKARLAAFLEYFRTHPVQRRTLLGIAATLLLGSGLLVWLLVPYLKTFGDIGAGPENAPSRLYGAPTVLEVGREARVSRLGAELAVLGYRPSEGDTLPAGRFRAGDDSLAVRLRRRMTPEGPVPGQLLTVQVERGRIEGLRVDGQPVERVALEAPVLATWYGDEARERWPVRVADLPEHVVQAVLAAEDDSFYWHPGVSPTGIARAALVNLRKGEVSQGGSTLTQQLVKNVFLTHERSFFRKIREAVIAVAVEAQHSKRDILQSYLNGIYMGGGRGVQYYGLGAVARAYFGKDATELTLEEAALLAGAIKAPAVYSPLQHPEKARARRDEVLRRMAELKWIDAATLERALRAPVETAPLRLGGRLAPHFGDAMAAEARERFGLRRLGNQGHHLFSTLRLPEQALAEEAVADVLDDLDRRGRRGRRTTPEPLEAALLSVDPATGAILAYVGGRDYERSEFDRVSQARRQAGSVFKPIVLVAALEAGDTSPATLLDDKPLTLKAGGKSWTPRNSDGAYRGPITARRAMEQSRNVPLVRLAMDVGLDQVAATARRMGIAGPMEEVPALPLGSAGVSPREVATVYATLASGGLRPTVHGLSLVLDPKMQPVQDLRPPTAEQALDPKVAFVATAVLEGVVRRGTAAGVRRYRISGALAGKTGTTNEARDSWFAGYRPDRVTVVWVGHDNPASTRFSGSRAALPIWGRYMKEALPEMDGDDFPEPEGIERATICPDSGLRARADCPAKIREAFLPGQPPNKVCGLEHLPPIDPDAPDFGERLGGWLKRKLGKVFGDN
ncbi:MAG TPA: PBP1A family penicillin-binding protein [Thermoanaerobaculia bacterium]|nr:PBP1A family penicillin-binding protein [Thermoanaerobaculia bacterium]